MAGPGCSDGFPDAFSSAELTKPAEPIPITVAITKLDVKAERAFGDITSELKQQLADSGLFQQVLASVTSTDRPAATVKLRVRAATHWDPA